MTYPDHIYDPQRLELVGQLLEKEFQKLFPSLSAEQLNGIIKDWRTNPATYHLEDSIRDFWDITAALFESIKLKSSFTAFLTARNYTWRQENVDPAAVQLSSPLHQLTLIRDFTWTDETTLGDVLTAIRHTGAIEEQRHINDTHSTPQQDAYPIIVRKIKDGPMRVMDGNRRLLRAGLYDKQVIAAWVAYSDDLKPQDFWVPTNDLMQLVKYFALANTAEEKQSIRNTLEVLLRSSVIARINFETRVQSQNKWSDELMSLAPTV